ncbi:MULTISPECIES: P-II family nitrogen regulator [Desulfosporosinus]|uniref:Nitrogen regulatory protein P-II n=1 Tax=Desulfosporosinus acididurans TaxID=476652 RepID=A0A0J1FR34_9FIRM|nr:MULTISPECIES: P-II family nitrogen regulator [Desulfosporosinus]KLU65954.1 nitrogen regulatory protein P-II [Desulfosporosinus acididurans]
MVKLEIITRSEKLVDVKKILAKHDYIGLTVTAVMGCGHQKGRIKEFEGLNLEINLLPKVQVMTVVLDEDVEEILTELHETISTGNVGDGKVFISDVRDVMRIRTGERGEKTL